VKIKNTKINFISKRTFFHIEVRNIEVSGFIKYIGKIKKMNVHERVEGEKNEKA